MSLKLKSKVRPIPLELETYYGYDDIIIKPRYSIIKSRSDVDLDTKIGKLTLGGPIISANMDRVTSYAMCNAMEAQEGLGILHRFWSIEDNIEACNKIDGRLRAVSVGIGEEGLKRAKALYREAGATIFCLDVAHGSQLTVAKQLIALKEMLKDDSIYTIVGNFATYQSIVDFLGRIPQEHSPDCFKVGISNGAACTTRVKTGVGIPQFSSVYECAQTGYPIIADGGIKNPGDAAKALAAGASAVMVGRLFAGTDESPGEIRTESNGAKFKIYRGLASKEVSTDNGRDAAWRTSEGVSYKVPYVGSVENIVNDLECGIRSSMSYVGAKDLKEFRSKIIFGLQTENGYKEGQARG